jgi:hypothetical protein
VTTHTITSTPYNGLSATGTEIRAWVQAMHDALAAIGMVQTSDTGQVNISTMLNASATNTAVGYEVWRFDDAAQATCPIVFKLEYGRGAGVGYAQMWLTVGSGSDGAGNITGVRFARAAVGPGGNTGTASTTGYASSGDGSMCALVPWPAVLGNAPMFIIERARNADGTPRAEDFLVAAQGTSNSTCDIYAYDCAGGNYTRQGAVAVVPGNVSGTNMGSGTSLAAGTLGPAYTLLNYPPAVVPWQALAVVAYPPGDRPSGEFTLHTLGADHNYLALPPGSLAGWVYSLNGSTSTLVAQPGCLALWWE